MKINNTHFMVQQTCVQHSTNKKCLNNDKVSASVMVDEQDATQL